MLAKDSDLSNPVIYDTNTAVGDYPWEEASFGATHSYNTLAMSNMTNPFSQVMEPSFDARPEAVIESKTDGSDTVEQLAKDDVTEDEYSGGTDLVGGTQTTSTISQTGTGTMAAEGISGTTMGTGLVAAVLVTGLFLWWRRRG